MKTKNYFVVILIVLSFSGFAQRSNNWFFGNNAGLSFSTNPPSVLSGGQTTNPDNTSAISDANGNLLFYTDGVTVWNSMHAVMLNGSGLIGSYTAGQCAIIVPLPCTSDKYVIFHVTEFSSPGQLHYTLVDMSLNSGLGDVVSSQKNVSLGTGYTEKLCAYYNSVNKNYWVLTHKWNSDVFIAFEVNASSIAANSVTTAIGSSHTCGSYSGPHDGIGQLTISQDGTKVLNALTCQDKFELFNFNSSTGILSNSISIASAGGYAWGTAFSPDNTKIYTNSIFGTSIYQYDISTYNQTAVLASQTIVATVTNSGYNFGYMELGPDNKLYIARPGNTSLAVVNTPNNYGAACNFSLAGQSLGSNTSNHGLSRIAYNIPLTAGSLSVTSSTSTLCSGNSATLSVLGSGSFVWTPSVSLSSTVGSSVSASPSVTTQYTLSATGGTCGNSGVITISVFPTPTVLLSPTSTSLCSGGTPLTIIAAGASNYNWTPSASLSSSTGVSVVANPNVTTIYTVTGQTGNCAASAMVAISVFSQPALLVTGPTQLICRGQSAALAAFGAEAYNWSTGQTGTLIIVNPPSTAAYTVTGTNAYGCTKTSVYTVSVTICEGISSQNQDAGIRIYPNPSKDFIVIESMDSWKDLIVMDCTGKVVEKISNEALQNSVGGLKLDLNNLDKGIYFLKGNYQSQTLTYKFIKD